MQEMAVQFKRLSMLLGEITTAANEQSHDIELVGHSVAVFKLA